MFEPYKIKPSPEIDYVRYGTGILNPSESLKRQRKEYLCHTRLAKETISLFNKECLK